MNLRQNAKTEVYETRSDAYGMPNGLPATQGRDYELPVATHCPVSPPISSGTAILGSCPGQVLGAILQS